MDRNDIYIYVYDIDYKSAIVKFKTNTHLTSLGFLMINYQNWNVYVYVWNFDVTFTMAITLYII